MIMMKDTNKAMHLFVLQNQALTIDEVRHMVGLRNINPQVLVKVAQNRTWMRDRGVCMAMVTNPKTPPQVGKQCLSKLTFMELRRLIKMGDVPPRVVMDAKAMMKKMQR